MIMILILIVRQEYINIDGVLSKKSGKWLEDLTEYVELKIIKEEILNI
jgi:hypothetical protein